MRVLVAAALAALALPAVASAHIQVRPAEAAPGDPVLWEVVVPSEQRSGTRQVELAIPAGVLPFSYEDAPGWTRTLRTKSDGSVASIVWKGRTAGDGLATFRFLASTPEEDGELAWKALQTYRDGDLVRWIGDEGTEHPASFTRVAGDVARQNAGGEGAEAPAAPRASGAPARAAGEDEHTDWFARGIGLAAVVIAGAGVALVVRRRA